MQSAPIGSPRCDIAQETGIIRVGEMDIQPATVDGAEEVFSVAKFTLVKPRWVDDNDVSTCHICQQAFSQFRRKHHCRFCGQILCSKCCSQKVAMPQLGYNTAERVCEDCCPIAASIKNTFASEVSEKYEAVRVLLSQLQDPGGTRRFLEAGGLQIFIHLLQTKNRNLWMAICSGLLQLCSYEPIQMLVIKTGVIQAFRSWLLSGEAAPEEVQRDCISILQMLCQTHQTRQLALSAGVLDCTLEMCIRSYGENMLLALGTLSLLVEEPSTHDILVNGHSAVIARMFNYVVSTDEQVQEISLKIIAHLSLSPDQVKQKLIQEDRTAGQCLLRVLQSQPVNTQILCNAMCAVANMAASYFLQNAMADFLPPICQLMCVPTYNEHRELNGHIVRALANYAANSVHGPTIMTHWSTIMSRFLKSQHTELRYQGLKLVMRLVSHSWQASSSFYREDVIEILGALSEKKDVMSAMDIALTHTVPGQMRPS